MLPPMPKFPLVLRSAVKCWQPLLASAALLLSPVVASGQGIPAFPGAAGAGAFAKGGRGGDVYCVTNLNSSGPGSLSYGLSTGVPSAGRTIIFGVSGYASMRGTLRLVSSKITIAGQTAPGDGFGLVGGTFRISGDDVVIRHMRFRNGVSADTINVDSGSINSIFDHCDVLFGKDENFSSFDSPPDNLTFGWSLNAWGLESHSCGGLWDQNHATSHHSLWAHNHTRNPKARPAVLDWVNNVTFDWDIGFILGDSQTPANWNSNVVGNYFLSGTPKTRALEKGGRDRNGQWNFHVFLENNRLDGNVNGLLDGTDTGWGMVSGDVEHLTARVANTGAPVATDDPLTAFKKVVSAAGPLRLGADATVPLRDEVGTILINNLVTQRRHHISNVSQTGASEGGLGMLRSTTAPTDSDRDGMPDFWETTLGFDPGADDHNAVFASSGGFVTAGTFFPAQTPAGYTRLEEYLHFRAIPHGVVAKNTAAEPSFLDVDLRKYTSGFSNTPVFAVTGVTGGSITLSGPGGHLARFTPAVNGVGRAQFRFAVTDAEGSTWAQQFGILISAAGVPRDLLWKGDGAQNRWDSNAQNWISKGATTAFSVGDAVLIDNLGSAAPAIELAGTIFPGAVVVDAAKNYSFAGSGSLGGAMALTKSGAGTLTLANTTANSYSGGTFINQGAVIVGTGTSLGSGPLVLGGAAVTLPNSSTIASAVKVDAESTINATSGSNFLKGGLTGSGDLRLNIATFTPEASWAGYSGRVTIVNNGTLRFSQGGNPWGAANAAFDLGAAGGLNNRAGSTGQTIILGALSGGAGSRLTASDQAGAVTDTYVIGGLGLDTTFAGEIRNGSSHALALTKAGSGTLTFAGSAAYTGPTMVAAGTLAVTGALGNTAISVEPGATLHVEGATGAGVVTVKSGATLAGTGTLGGAVTAQTGATISPGSTSGATGDLRMSGGLALNAANLHFDLSSLAAGANDRITLNGGPMTLNGAQTFLFHWRDGELGQGTYSLIEGGTNTAASGAALNTNLPAGGTRQTFTMQRSTAGSGQGFVRLNVSGNAAALQWTGASGIWDLNAAANWSGGPTPTFFNLDAVTFDDTGANRNVSLTADLQPRSIAVTNNGAPYTLGGTGVIGGAASLTKTGSGTLILAPAWVSLMSTATLGTAMVTVPSTVALRAGMLVAGTGIPAGTSIAEILDGTQLRLSQNATASAAGAAFSFITANTYSGGTSIGPGSTIALTNHAANSHGLGTGPVTFLGGTLAMYDPGAAIYTGPLPNGLVVATTGTLRAAPRTGITGALSGSGVLDFFTPFVRTDVTGDWSRFTGQIKVLTDADGGDFRFGTSYSYPGFPNASLHLSDKVNAYFIGILAAGAGTTIEIGEVTGTSGAQLRGGGTAGRGLTYRIGSRTPAGVEATFAGTIGEQIPSTSTSYVKTGPGVWRLSGTAAYNGSTTIEQGGLRVSGSLSSGGSNFLVLNGATLELAGGTVTTADLQIAEQGSLTGQGALVGDLTNAGTVTCNAGELSVTGDVVNNGTMRFTGNAALVASGSFVNNGVLDLLRGAQQLPANFQNNGIVIDSSSLRALEVKVAGSTATLRVQTYVGHRYQLQRTGSLVGSAWSNVGPVQIGDGTVRTFTDLAATDLRRFYRVQVSS